MDDEPEVRPWDEAEHAVSASSYGKPINARRKKKRRK